MMQVFSQSRVARQLGLTHSTVSRLRQRLRQTGRLFERPRTVEQPGVKIVPYVETAANTRGRQNNMIDPKTVRNRLKEAGLHARRPYVGPQLTPRRRNWLRRQSLLQFPLHPRRQVLFSDESLFSLYSTDGQKRVYGRQRERFSDACVNETDKIWRRISNCLGWHCTWNENTPNRY